MANLIVERDNLVNVMQEWLVAIGVQKEEKLEVTFLQGEVLIRPQSEQRAELDAWLDETTRKYDSLLKRLAVS